MTSNEKANKIFEGIYDIMPENEKKFKDLYIEKIYDVLTFLEKEENQSSDQSPEWRNWHIDEEHKMATRDSNDWSLAERYKNAHPDYSKNEILISEVWRDINNVLCVRYINCFGRNLDWFHYVRKNSEVTWW